MSITIKDIARLSGYSLGTVSRVLNGHPDVSAAARERVMAVVQEQGFEPNANARHLKMRAQSAVAVLVKGSRNLLFADILERIQSLLQDSGEEVYVAYLDEDTDEVQYAVQLEKLRRPKGFLFLGGDLECFRRGFAQVTAPSVLLTNDAHGALVGNAAKDWYTEDGGKTWTFVLNDGMKWVDKDGNEKADVVAEDWIHRSGVGSEFLQERRLQHLYAHGNDRWCC